LALSSDERQQARERQRQHREREAAGLPMIYAALARERGRRVAGRRVPGGTTPGTGRVPGTVADNSFRITSRGVLADAARVVHFADGEAAVGGELRRWRTVGIFNISNGLIAECWLLPFDQYQFDEIWGGR